MVSIIIVNYNTAELTKKCIESIRQHVSGVRYEIILVDNASTDGSKEYFSKETSITYVYNDYNCGFGKANNIGAEYAHGDYLFFLNSDTVLSEDSISILLYILKKDHSIGAIGPLLVDRNGKDNGTYYKFRPATIKDRIHLRLSHQGAENKTGYICGAALLMRRDLFVKLNGFDERFFMYFEEQDLQKRIYEEGFTCDTTTNTSILHLRGASTKIAYNGFKMRQKSLNIYGKKHFHGIEYFQFRLCNILGVLLMLCSKKCSSFNVKQKYMAMKDEIAAYGVVS